MERSKQPSGLYRGQYVTHGSQSSRLRRLSIDEILADEFQEDEDVRYSRSLKVDRPVKGERTQPSELGDDARDQ